MNSLRRIQYISYSPLCVLLFLPGAVSCYVLSSPTRVSVYNNVLINTVNILLQQLAY